MTCNLQFLFKLYMFEINEPLLQWGKAGTFLIYYIHVLHVYVIPTVSTIDGPAIHIGSYTATWLTEWRDLHP